MDSATRNKDGWNHQQTHPAAHIHVHQHKQASIPL
jgi:hypothetical protein